MTITGAEEMRAGDVVKRRYLCDAKLGRKDRYGDRLVIELGRERWISRIALMAWFDECISVNRPGVGVVYERGGAG